MKPWRSSMMESTLSCDRPWKLEYWRKGTNGCCAHTAGEGIAPSMIATTINVWQYTRGIQGEFVLWKLLSFCQKPPKSPPRFFSLSVSPCERRSNPLDLTGLTTEHTCLVTTSASNTTTALAIVVNPYPS